MGGVGDRAGQPPAEPSDTRAWNLERLDGARVLGSRFGRRLLLLFLACALVPILFLGWFAYREVTQSLRAQSERRLVQQTKAVALGIVERLLHLEGSLDLVGLEVGASADRGIRLTSAARQILGRQLEALVIEREGGARTSILGEDFPPPALELMAREHLARGKMLVVANARLSEHQPIADRGAMLAPVLVAKRVDPDRPERGTLWAHLAGTYLWDVGPDSGLPPQTELAVLDRQGFLVRADPVPATLAARFLDDARSDGIGLEWQADGQTYLASHRTVPLATNYAAGPWVVSMSRRLDLALEPVAGFRRDFPRFVLLLALVVFLVSLGQIRRSLAPLGALASGTRRLARRDFSEPVTIESGDELEDLAAAFNAMAATLERQLRAVTTMAEVGRRSLADPREAVAVETLLQGLPEILPAGGAEVVLADDRGGGRRFTRHPDGWVDETRLAPRDVRGAERGDPDRISAEIASEGSVAGEVALVAPGRLLGTDENAILRELADHLGLVLRHVKLRGALDRERERLRSLVEHLPNGVIVLDEHRHVQLANRLGRASLEILTEVEIDGEVSTLAGREVEALESHGQVQWHELEVIDDIRRLLVVAITPLDLGDAGAGSVIVVRDVTSERLAEERAHRQERLATVGQMAAGIAHDFNNVLQGIMMGAGLLAARFEGRETQVILDQCRRAGDMISRILDFTRASTSRPVAADLRAVVSEGIRLIETAVPESISVTTTLPEEALPARVDSIQIQQAVQNLVVNARDAMPDGGVLTVSLEDGKGTPAFAPAGHPGPWYLLRVADTGNGIPVSVRPHIFDPFYTTKALGVGTGLGLAQVATIVEQHGGGIDVVTGSDGTTFTIALPSSGKLLSETTDEAVAEPKDESPSRRLVVVVDDDEAVLESVRNGLIVLGHRVIAMRSADEVLRLLADPAVQVDLVLSDVRMPGLSGLELQRRIAQLEDPPPVVMMSGYVGMEADEVAPENLAGWLPKPFAFDDLARVTGSALGDSPKR